MSSIKIKTKRLTSGYLLRILITHPMETGRRRETDGTMVPAHFIETVKIDHNGKTIANGQFGAGVSRDPYLSLRLRDAKPGDNIRVVWLDNLGQSDNEESLVL